MSTLNKYIILITVFSTLVIFVSTSYAYEIDVITKNIIDIKDNVNLEFSEKEMLFISSDVYIDRAHPTVKLISDNETEATYNMYLSILYNDFKNLHDDVYLLLEIKDGAGDIYFIDDLRYKKINNIKGYDLTNKEGLLPLVIDQGINNSSIKEEFTIKVNIINLTDNDYSSKTFIAEIILCEGYYNLPIIQNY